MVDGGLRKHDQERTVFLPDGRNQGCPQRAKTQDHGEFKLSKHCGHKLGPSRTLHICGRVCSPAVERGHEGRYSVQKSPPLREGGQANVCRGAVSQAGQGGECSMIRVSSVGWEDWKQSNEGSALSHSALAGEGS